MLLIIHSPNYFMQNTANICLITGTQVSDLINDDDYII